MGVVFLFDTPGKEHSSSGAREVSFNSSYSCSMQKFLTSKALQLLGGRGLPLLHFSLHKPRTFFFFWGDGKDRVSRSVMRWCTWLNKMSKLLLSSSSMKVIILVSRRSYSLISTAALRRREDEKVVSVAISPIIRAALGVLLYFHRRGSRGDDREA